MKAVKHYKYYSAYNELMTSHAADSRNGRHLESVTSYPKYEWVNPCVFTLEKQYCHISPRSDLKLQSLGLFW